MTVPNWMRPDTPPPPGRESVRFPFVLDQRPGPDHTVRVTFALPGLRTCILTVPEASWINGEHLHAAPMLMAMLDDINPDVADDVGPWSPDDSD